MGKGTRVGDCGEKDEGGGDCGKRDEARRQWAKG